MVDIKLRVGQGEQQTKLAREYGVSGQQVWRIVHGASWGDVDVF